MELSILVPVYNTEKYLRRCVDSLLAQTVEDYEVVLVDDGSTDGSGSICDEYARENDRVHVIHQENAGSSAARLAGIRASCGAYLGFVDSDDYVEPDMYERLLAPVRQDAAIEISISGHVVDSMNGTIEHPCSAEHPISWDDGLEAMEEMFANRKFTWSLCDKIYARRLLTDEDSLSHWPHSHGEDTFINAKVMPLAKRIIFQPIYGYHYCMNPESMMHAAFHPGKLVTVDILADLIEKYTNRSKLMNAIGQIFLQMMELYLKDMQQAYPAYQEFLARYQNLVLEYMPRLFVSEKQKRVLAVLLRKPKEYLACKHKMEQELWNFCQQGQGRLYVYGTGIYGKKTAALLANHDILFQGYVETMPKIADFQGMPVMAARELRENDFVVLGLSEQHSREVKKTLNGRVRNLLPMYFYFACFSKS